MDSKQDHSPPLVPPRRPGEQVPAWFPRALLMTVVAVLATLGMLWVVRKLGRLLIVLLLALFLSFALERPYNTSPSGAAGSGPPPLPSCS